MGKSQTDYTTGPRAPIPSDVEPSESQSAVSPDDSSSIQNLQTNFGPTPGGASSVSPGNDGSVQNASLQYSQKLMSPATDDDDVDVTTEMQLKDDEEWEKLLAKFDGPRGIQKHYPDLVEWTRAARKLDITSSKSVWMMRMMSVREMVAPLDRVVDRIPERKEVCSLLRDNDKWRYLPSPKSPVEGADLPEVKLPASGQRDSLSVSQADWGRGSQASVK
eukprot:gene74-443_t